MKNQTGKAPAFQWYPKDCDTDEKVRLMDDEHFGFYVRCLNHAWLNEGLPESLSDIAAALGRRPWKVRKLWEKVGVCFELSEKRWTNSKQESQRKTVREFIESRRQASVTRWNKKESEKIEDARASENECTWNARAMHVESSASASASASAKKSSVPEFPSGDSAFRKLATIYSTGGKPASEKDWQRAAVAAVNEGITDEEIIKRVIPYVRDKLGALSDKGLFSSPENLFSRKPFPWRSGERPSLNGKADFTEGIWAQGYDDLSKPKEKG